MAPPVGFRLVGSGILMGTIHVVTGPDHLSALATLSANVGNWKAFSLGVRWGVGHSVGLVVVAIVLIASSQGGEVGLLEIQMSQTLSMVLETLVGVFMLFLGIFGFISAIVKEQLRKLLPGGDLELGSRQGSESQLGGVESSASSVSDPQDVDSGTEMESLAREETEPGTTGDGGNIDDADVFDDVRIEPLAAGAEASLSVSDLDDSAMLMAVTASRSESDGDDMGMDKYASGLDVRLDPHSGRRGQFRSELYEDEISTKSTRSLVSSKSTRSLVFNRHKFEFYRKWGDRLFDRPGANKFVAFLIGIVHGVAGPGGVLGVIPAVHLHNWRLASIYLGTFCITSMLMMGLFAATYGTCSEKVSSAMNLQFHMECISSALSIVVGITWLCLTFAGKLGVVMG